MMFWLILVLFLVWFFYLRKLYTIDTRDTIVAFTGGLGSGKTFWSVQTAIKALRFARLRWFLMRIIKPKEKKPKPMLYSSIPVRISFKEMSRVLTPDILLLQVPIEEYSIVLIDEIGGFCSQFDYQVKNVEYFDDFIRYFRHYIGGKLIVNDQCSENIVLQVRRRINTVYNLMGCRFYGMPFGRKLVARVKVRHIMVSEEIKTIEEGHVEDGHQTALTLVPWFRRYASRCYRCRYEDLGTDFSQERYDRSLNTKRRLRIPNDQVDDKISLKNVVKLNKRQKEITNLDLFNIDKFL